MGRRTDSGFEEFEHNQWTIEGRIERAGRMRGSRIRTAPSGVRWFLRVVFGLCALLFVVAALAAVIDAV